MDYFRSFGIEVGQGKYHEEAIYGIVLLYNLINGEISSFLKPYELTPAKFNVLMTIKHQGGSSGISQVEISKHLIVTPSNMTRLLDKLEKEKLVHRISNKNDRRANIIKISERGGRLLDSVWPGYQKVLRRLGSLLTKAEQKTFDALLMKWISEVKSA